MKRIAALFLSLSMLLALVACGPDTSVQPSDPANQPSDNTAPTAGQPSPAVPITSGEPQYGGSLNLSYTCRAATDVFDPAVASDQNYTLWYETLFCMNWGLDDDSLFKDQNITQATAQGQIADSWEWDADNLVMTVKIREDVYFQTKEGEYNIFNGRQLTAEDVKWSYDRVLGTGSGFDDSNRVILEQNWAEQLGFIDNIEVLDEFTLQFYFNNGSANNVDALFMEAIRISGPEWDTLTDAQKSDWHYACGTGPYILTGYEPNSYYQFTRNDNYYDYDERYPENQLPYLDELTLTMYSDTTLALADFISGNIDFLGYGSGLSSSEITQLESTMGEGNYYKFGYGTSSDAICLKMNFEPFSDVRVREAMQHAIDIENITTSYLGLDFELPGLWISDSEWHSSADWPEELKAQYTYDPDLAKQLLSDAGYPDGFSFDIVVAAMMNDMAVMELAKSYLAAVGIEMNIIVASDMMQLFSTGGDSSDPTVVGSPGGDCRTITAALKSFVTGGSSYTMYHEDNYFDNLITSARDAQTVEQRAELCLEADSYYGAQHWMIMLAGCNFTYDFVSTKVGGMDNGEMINCPYYLSTISARIWANA